MIRRTQVYTYTCDEDTALTLKQMYGANVSAERIELHLVLVADSESGQSRWRAFISTAVLNGAGVSVPPDFQEGGRHFGGSAARSAGQASDYVASVFFGIQPAVS